MSRLILLGPQHQETNLGEVAADLNLKGPVAVITAGWQEREAEVAELEAHLGVKTINLMLHQRGEAIFEEDEEYREAHRANMTVVKRLQDLYRVRLTHYMDAVRQVIHRESKFSEDVWSPELEDAFEVVRRLDDHHLRRINEVHDSFQENWPIADRPCILHHLNELADTLERCDAVVVAGGHVAVLLNRLRLLNLAPILGEKDVIAWGAGAMCLGPQVVLFHDSPPQGSGYAEMFEAGLGLYRNVLPLPHADRRLLLDDTDRVTLFARRFRGQKCLTLVTGSRLDFQGGKLKRVRNVQALAESGLLEEVAP